MSREKTNAEPAVAYQRILSPEEASELKADTDRFFALAEAEPVRNLGGRPAKNKSLRSMKLSHKFQMVAKIVASHRGISIDEYVDEVLFPIALRDFKDGPGKVLDFGPSTKTLLGTD